LLNLYNLMISRTLLVCLFAVVRTGLCDFVYRDFNETAGLTVRECLEVPTD
jgi:hypothetical protein